MDGHIVGEFYMLNMKETVSHLLVAVSSWLAAIRVPREPRAFMAPMLVGSGH